MTTLTAHMIARALQVMEQPASPREETVGRCGWVPTTTCYSCVKMWTKSTWRPSDAPQCQTHTDSTAKLSRACEYVSEASIVSGGCMGRGLAAERACQPTAVAAVDQQLRSEAIEVARRDARVGRVQWDSLVRARRVGCRLIEWKPVECFSTLRLLALEVDVCTCDSAHSTCKA